MTKMRPQRPKQSEELAGLLMPLDYSKFDNIVDSDDEEGASRPSVAKNRGQELVERRTDQQPAMDPSKRAEGTAETKVKAGFVLKVRAKDGAEPLFINVCSSTIVEDVMHANPDRKGLGVTFPYQLGHLRKDVEGTLPCRVLEIIFSPGTLAGIDNKQTHHALITAAVRIVSQYALPLHEDSWELFTHKALREVDGTYFFPPMRLISADAPSVPESVLRSGASIPVIDSEAVE